MNDRFAIGIAYPSRGVVRLPTATFIKEKDGGYVVENVSHAEIPIPESLTGCPDDSLVFLTPSGLMAWERDGKLVTGFDHVNDGQVIP